MTDPTETPIGDQVAAEQASTTETAPAQNPDAANVDSDAGTNDGPGSSGPRVDEMPRLGFHEGYWHSTRTVAGELSAEQVQDAVHEALLEAQNNGYVAASSSPDVQAHTFTGEDGKPTQVVIRVAVAENRIDQGEAAPADETPEG
jgi:hypothetical protein